MDFVSDFQRLKDSSGKTVKEIAEACGLSESTVTRYLSGKNAPPVDVAEAILKYLSESAPDAAPEESWILMLIEAYKQQIAALRADHEKSMRRMQNQHFTMLGMIGVMIAVIIYLIIDATHGGWGFFRYSAEMLATGAL